MLYINIYKGNNELLHTTKGDWEVVEMFLQVYKVQWHTVSGNIVDIHC